MGKLNFIIKLVSIFDVLFSHQFELTTWDKSGKQKSKTKYLKNEHKGK